MDFFLSNIASYIRPQTPNNRTVGTQLVVPPSGCLVVSVTAAQGQCLQDASFKVRPTVRLHCFWALHQQ